MTDNDDRPITSSEFKEFRKFMEIQCDHGRSNFEQLKQAGTDRTTQIENLNVRMAALEQLKVRAEGFRSGVIWSIAIGSATFTSVVVWLVNKVLP